MKTVRTYGVIRVEHFDGTTLYCLGDDRGTEVGPLHEQYEDALDDLLFRNGVITYAELTQRRAA
jgi:hypothetical protein